MQAYSLDLALDGENKFTDTGIDLDGTLWYVENWPKRGQASVYDVRDMKHHYVEYTHVDFSPRLEPGYYNLADSTMWLSMSPVRQYKVGLNSDNVQARDMRLPYLSQPIHATFVNVVEAYNNGMVFPTTWDSMAERFDRNKAVALTDSIAIHSSHLGHAVLVHECAVVIGMVTPDGAFIDRACEHSVPPYMEQQYVSVEDLVGLWQKGAQTRLSTSDSQ